MNDFRFDSLTWIAKNLGFLKRIPLLGILLDDQIKLMLFILKPKVFRKMIRIVREVRTWKGVTTSNHIYGGIQFNYQGFELGHLHGNGLLDIRINRKMKEKALIQKDVFQHHILGDSLWLSYKIRNHSKEEVALELLRKMYLNKSQDSVS